MPNIVRNGWSYYKRLSVFPRLSIGFISGTIAFSATALLFNSRNPVEAQTNPPSISGNCNAVGNNNSNCGTYINQAPLPTLAIIQESNWEKLGDDYQLTIAVKVSNAGSTSKMRITARGVGVTHVGFGGEGMMANGAGDTGDGWAYMESMTPTHVRFLIVYAKQPTKVQIESAFE